MVTWHAGTLLLRPESLRDPQYAVVFFMGAGAGLVVGLAPALMTAELIRRCRAFQPLARRLVLLYGLGVLLISSAVDVLRAGTLVTVAAIPIFLAVLMTLPAAIAGSLMTPSAALLAAGAVMPLTVMLIVVYRHLQRVLGREVGRRAAA